MTRIDRWCNNITDAIVVLGVLCLLLGAMSCHVHYHVTIKTDGETPHQKPKNDVTYYLDSLSYLDIESSRAFWQPLNRHYGTNK